MNEALKYRSQAAVALLLCLFTALGPAQQGLLSLLKLAEDELILVMGIDITEHEAEPGDEDMFAMITETHCSIGSLAQVTLDRCTCGASQCFVELYVPPPEPDVPESS